MCFGATFIKLLRHLILKAEKLGRRIYRQALQPGC